MILLEDPRLFPKRTFDSFPNTSREIAAGPDSRPNMVEKNWKIVSRLPL
jgi:hypothetical protein